MTRCATCGYPRDVHEVGTNKCPLCACGELPAAHAVTVEGEHGCPCGCGATPEAHERGRAQWLGAPCPGRRSSTSGKWLLLRQGSYKPPAAPVPRREWFGMLVPVVEPARVVEAVRVAPPEVSARPPAGPGEFASYGGKQAAGLGRKAAGSGWDVRALYWRAGTGVEGCAVRLARGPLRAVATWKRAAGRLGEKSGWAADVAYAWRIDVERFPTEVTHTQLEGLILQ